MASYTLHLGFNWDSPRIGTLFGASGATEARFLHFALADASGQPAWFSFEPGDVVQLKIYDLSSEKTLDFQSFYVAFGPVSQPDGDVLSTYAPDSIAESSTGAELSTTTIQGQTVVYFNSYASTPGGDSPWGPAQHTYTMSVEMKLLARQQPFEMGFSLHIADASAGEVRRFVADPEVIVGSGGSQE